VQAGVGELHFRLHAHGPHDRHIGCRRDQVLQQRRLACARVAAYYQRPALTGSDRIDKLVQRAALGMPVRQSCRAAPPPRICDHSHALVELTAARPQASRNLHFYIDRSVTFQDKIRKPCSPWSYPR